MYWVSCTDLFMSDWGCSQGKLNRLVFVCDSLEQARVVALNAKNRGDMSHIKIHGRHKPKFTDKIYFTQEKTQDDYPHWYIHGYYQKGEAV